MLGRKRSTAFTLVELLVVIAIIGILIALLLPAVQAAREAARRSQCSNNLKQVVLALHNYHDTHRVFPPGSINHISGINPPQLITWSIAILPFIEQSALHDQYNMNLTNTDSANAPVVQAIVTAYTCPSDPTKTKLENPASGSPPHAFRHASYRGVTGYSTNGGCWFDCEQWRTADPPCNERHKGLLHATGPNVRLDCEDMGTVKDGSSNTLAVGEYYTSTTTNRGTFWAFAYTSFALSSFTWRQPRSFGGDYDVCVAIGGTGSSNVCKRAFGSAHPGGAQFAIADGSCRFLSETTDIDLLCYLSTVAGGETAMMP